MNYQFRGFSLQENRWVYGSLICRSARWGNHYSILELVEDIEEGEDDKEIAVYFPSCGQFTGLKDKNSCPIYEGDIVKTNNLLAEKFVCKWNSKNGCWCFRIKDDDISFHVYYHEFNGDIEVIGNIYQNREIY